jgi:hypothetical protein
MSASGKSASQYVQAGREFNKYENDKATNKKAGPAALSQTRFGTLHIDSSTNISDYRLSCA